MSCYANIFSALYDWNLGQWHDEEYAALLTAFGLAGGMSFPIGISGAWTAELASIEMRKPVTFAIVVAAFAGHYWLFMRGGRYKRLYEGFCERAPAERNGWKRIAWAWLIFGYVVIPIGTGLFGLLFLR